MSNNSKTEGKVVIPPEKPAQVITSPDGKLQTLHHRMIANFFGHKLIEGVVKNISTTSDLDAEVSVEFYDTAGALMGTEVEIVRRLSPGKTGAFEAVHSGPKRSYVKHYELKLHTKS